jgi:mRNA-degrading endonuclease toxin of MazEF toxin-antitoxin module
MEAPEIKEGDDPVTVDDEALKYAEWVKNKARLRYGAIESGSFKKTQRPKFGITVGGIYWGYYGTNIGDEMNKRRPLMVVRSIKASNMCTVVPLSTKRMNDDYYFHVDLEKRDGTAIVEQLRTIDKIRLEERVHYGGKTVEATDKDLKDIFAAIERYHADPPPWLKERWKKAEEKKD